MAIKRVQSPPYPSLPFDEAIRRSAMFQAEHGDGYVDHVGAVKAIGYSSVSGSSKRALNALRQYGLVSFGERGYRSSALANRLNADPADSTLRRTAAWSPQVFRSIKSRFEGRTFSDMEATSLLTTLGYVADASELIIRNYKRIVRDAALAAAQPVPTSLGAVEPPASTNPSKGQGPMEDPPSSRIIPFSAAVVSTEPTCEERTLFALELRPGVTVSIRLSGQADYAEVTTAVGVWIDANRVDAQSPRRRTDASGTS